MTTKLVPKCSEKQLKKKQKAKFLYVCGSNAPILVKLTTGYP